MALAGDGVLPRERLAEPVVAVEPVGDGEQAPDGRDVGLALGHRIEAAGVGEGVEVESAVVAVAPDLAEQLERRRADAPRRPSARRRAWRSRR